MMPAYLAASLAMWGRLMYGLGHDRVLDGKPWYEKALWVGLISVAAASWPITLPLAVVWQVAVDSSRRGGAR